jgi:hypothetical protein
MYNPGGPLILQRLNSAFPVEEVLPNRGSVVLQIGLSISVIIVGMFCWVPIEQCANIGDGFINVAVADIVSPGIGNFARSDNVIAPKQSKPNVLISAEYKTGGTFKICK